MKTATDDSAVDPSALPPVATNEDADPPDTGPPDTDGPRVDRCQRQFGDGDRRLRTLVDDENCAIYDGV